MKKFKGQKIIKNIWKKYDKDAIQEHNNFNSRLKRVDIIIMGPIVFFLDYDKAFDIVVKLTFEFSKKQDST